MSQLVEQTERELVEASWWGDLTTPLGEASR